MRWLACFLSLLGAPRPKSKPPARIGTVVRCTKTIRGNVTAHRVIGGKCTAKRIDTITGTVRT